MDWSALDLEDDEGRLLHQLVKLAPRHGVGARGLAEAACEEFGDRERWKTLFPGGVTQALWRISEISDASMRTPFLEHPAQGMTQVIEERFDQNRDLKPFVRGVMQYDVLHPVQALARMQRTAKVMFDCRKPRREPGFATLVSLNLSYTLLVFIWLCDRSPGDARTRSATLAIMRVLRL